MLSVIEYQAKLTVLQKAFLKKYVDSDLKNVIVWIILKDGNGRLLKRIRMDNECFYYIQLAIKNNLHILDTKIIDSDENQYLDISVIRVIKSVRPNMHTDKNVRYRIWKEDNGYKLLCTGKQTNGFQNMATINYLIFNLFEDLCYSLLSKSDLKKAGYVFEAING